MSRSGSAACAAAFEHSWRLLPADERTILQALSVFSGGFTRKAAEAVAGASLLSLAALMAKSLAVRTDNGRYDLHEMVRQYAAEKLEEAGEVAAIAPAALAVLHEPGARSRCGAQQPAAHGARRPA